MSSTVQSLNIAHRGARSVAPENTLAAARKAFEIGADGWELDVALSKDNEIVVVHDDTFDRTSNVATVFPERKGAKIHQFTIEEIRRLDFGSWYISKDPFKQISGGAVSKEEAEKFKGEKAPTLREALTLTRDNHWFVNVEIKDVSGTPGDATIVEKVVALIGEMNMDNQVLISSFNHSYLERVKKANPAIRTGALDEVVDKDPVALLRRIGADAYHPPYKGLEASTIQALRAAGYGVNVWTVNDEPTMRKLIEAGATGIITDYPQLVKPILASYK